MASIASNFSGYPVGGSATDAGGSDDSKDTKGYWSLKRLKRSYLDYLSTKREEIDEQQDARRFRHASQWTADQIKQLNLRKQPVVTNNKISRKIHGIVGTLERLKQDPKAYARTPKHEEGAELATAALRYALERTEWDSKDPICAEMAGVDGIGGIEYNIVEGDRGDKEVDCDIVMVDSFFYDPRSIMSDFSDARYMGVGKWLDLDTAIELFPDKEEELEAAMEGGSELTSEPDREQKWFQADDDVKRVRVVECWYKQRGDWYWCAFTGDTKLSEGKSPFLNEDNKTEHKYEMFSAYIDQDGDRYGFVRDLKPLQIEINMRRSKALYTMLGRRIKLQRGAVDDIEVTRREGSRPDGVVEYNAGFELEFDDSARMAETEAQFKFLGDVKTDFEQFGPNIAVTGEGLENSSGRAIHLLQQAGLADLGPFIQSYRAWKIRVYRKMWNAIQHNWDGERWIRVTDDDDISQFIQLNGVGIDPNTGMPTLVNAIGSLDVDIILDEGPDSVNMMADAYDTLTILAGKGAEIPPDVLIELAPLPMSLKKRILEKMKPKPDPEMEKRKQIETQLGVETVKEKGASAELKHAQAVKAYAEANRPPEQPDVQMPDAGDHPLKTQSEAADKMASARLKETQAAKLEQDMQMEPLEFAVEQQNAAETRIQSQADSERNFEINKMKAKQTPRKA